MGCVSTLEGVGNCSSLGLYHQEVGDFRVAGRAYATKCEIGMKAGAGEYFGQGCACYWAAKNARDNLRTMPVGTGDSPMLARRARIHLPASS